MKTDPLPTIARDIIVACVLLTRLPMPRLPTAAFDRSARAAWAWPLVGLLAGGLGAAVAALALAAGLPAMIAAGVLLATLALVTGAMHEDGLSDTADGFWGGQTAERRLEIMKDSRTGSYGVLALLLVTGLRWTAYAVLLNTDVLIAAAVAALSRAPLPAVMAALPNARRAGMSESVGRPPPATAALALGLATAASLLLIGAPSLAALLAACAAAAVTGWIAHRNIGGQTGDILGAAQQLAEVFALLALIAVSQ